MSSIYATKRSLSYQKYAKLHNIVNRVRKIGTDRTSEVEALCEMNKGHMEVFGPVNIEQTICESFIAIGLENHEKKLLGVVTLTPYPNVSAVAPWDWDQWFTRKYGLSDITVWNTLWLSLIAWHPEEEDTFLPPLMEFLFKKFYYVDFVLLMLPPRMAGLPFLDYNCHRMVPLGVVIPEGVQTVYILSRQRFAVTYSVRQAVVEDNDDLMLIIDNQTKKLRQCYGDYYIAELLTNDKENRQIIVAMVNDIPVGVLILNKNVNYELLQSEFEVGPYNGFMKTDQKYEPSYVRLSRLGRVSNASSVGGANFADSSQCDTLCDNRRLDEAMSKTVTYTLPESLQDFVDVEQSESDDYSIVLPSSDDDDNTTVLPEFIPEEEVLEIPLLFDMKSDLPRDVCHRTEFTCQEENQNAFALEVIATDPEHSECLHHLFRHSFECYPKRDYALLSVPHDVSTDHFSNYFNRLPLKSSGASENVLYVTHKNALNGKLHVELANKTHEISVKRLLWNIVNRGTVWKNFKSFLSGSEGNLMAYVMLCEEQVVGLAILSEEEDVEYLHSHYDVDQWIHPKLQRSGYHGTLVHCLLSTHFHMHAKYFLRELHRLSDYAILYYKLVTNDLNIGQSVNNVLQSLIPVVVRTQPVYNLEYLEDFAPAEQVMRTGKGLALFLSTVNNCSLERLTCNMRLVVVGGSAAGLSFLESLCWWCDPNYIMTFNSVFLVTEHGLIQPVHQSNFYRMKRNFVSFRLMEKLYYRTYVTTIRGTATNINRKEKFLVINGASFLRYDYLFLMCGEQFVKPPLKYHKEYPCNLFALNSDSDYMRMYGMYKSMRKYTKDPVIVYGYSTQTYCMLAALIDLGVPGQHIILVENFPETKPGPRKSHRRYSAMNHPELEAMMLDTIRSYNIKIYTSYTLLDWVCCNGSFLTTARFESTTQVLELDCSMLVCYDHRTLNTHTFDMVTKAGLVFDGRLVIDRECRTNDPWIYACGTMTKYSRRYYADHLMHKHFSREEVGHRLAEKIKWMLTPEEYRQLSERRVTCESRNDMMVPRYHQEMAVYGMLPGRMYYFSARKPGIRIPLELAMLRRNYGTVLETGNLGHGTDQYFRIHLNEFDCVETIICVSKQKIDVVNLASLWGKHEKLLNNLKLQYRLGRIKDFFTYFKQPWCYALYNDNWPNFEQKMERYLEENHLEFLDKLKGHVNECGVEVVIKNYYKEVLNQFTEEFTRQNVDKILLDMVIRFIEKNRSHLTMYAIPSLIQHFVSSFQDGTF